MTLFRFHLAFWPPESSQPVQPVLRPTFILIILIITVITIITIIAIIISLMIMDPTINVDKIWNKYEQNT